MRAVCKLCIDDCILMKQIRWMYQVRTRRTKHAGKVASEGVWGLFVPTVPAGNSSMYYGDELEGGERDSEWDTGNVRRGGAETHGGGDGRREPERGERDRERDMDRDRDREQEWDMSRGYSRHNPTSHTPAAAPTPATATKTAKNPYMQSAALLRGKSASRQRPV